MAAFVGASSDHNPEFCSLLEQAEEKFEQIRQERLANREEAEDAPESDFTDLILQVAQQVMQLGRKYFE